MKKILTVTAIVIAFGTFGARAALAADSCAPSHSWGDVSIPYAQQIVTAINDARAAAGVAPLAVSVSLTNAGMYRALHIAAFGDYGESNDQSVATACGYPSQAWANDAWTYTTPDAAMHGWMTSPEHKRALLDSAFRYIGVGAAYNSANHNWGWYTYFAVDPDGMSGDAYANFRGWQVASERGGSSSTGSSTAAQGFSPLLRTLTVKAGHTGVVNVTRGAMTTMGDLVKVKLVKVFKPTAGKAVKVNGSSIRYSAAAAARSGLVIVRFEFRAASGKTGFGLLKVHVLGR